ncbi:MAG TPA: hypothetical protein VF521_09185 [Pyrinomonadaceae bacterium]
MMRRTGLTLFTLPALCAFVLLMSPEAFACRAVPYKADRLAAEADVIVRATASRYAEAPAEKYKFSGVPGSLVEFKVLETLKGEGVPDILDINGYLDDRDDYNDRPVPYDFVRPGGRAGSCIANSYRKGAEFLLFLKNRDGKLTPYWAALSPTNEQLRPADDPWLKWVRDALAGAA